MLLEFAETQNAQPVHISRVRPGQHNTFVCPYCQQPVIARTRLTNQWLPTPHFAHIHQTCQYVEQYDLEEHIGVPLYRGFEHASDSQIAAGRLPLSEVYKLQQDATRYVYSLFHDDLSGTTGVPVHPEYRATDRKLFDWTLEKCSLFVLYLMEFRLTKQTVYLLGSSDQPEDVYLDECVKIFPPVDIIMNLSLRVALPQMASLEYYFQHRFRAHRYQFRNHRYLPDYFMFAPDVLEDVMAELQRLRYVTNTRRENILVGMLNARTTGKQIGRPHESAARFLRKKKSQEIAAFLAKGLNIQEIHKRTGYALATIRKVEALLHQQKKFRSDTL